MAMAHSLALRSCIVLRPPFYFGAVLIPPDLPVVADSSGLFQRNLPREFGVTLLRFIHCDFLKLGGPDAALRFVEAECDLVNGD